MTRDIILLAGAVGVVLCMIAVGAIVGYLGGSKKIARAYTLRPSLFTPAERSFLGCLDSILPPEIRVFAKVRLADLFEVKSTSDRSAWQSALNKISSKHVDFILCRASDLHPLLAIELDDKSHLREERQQRDVFLDELFATSGLPLIRFKAQKTYRLDEIAQRVNDSLASARDALH